MGLICLAAAQLDSLSLMHLQGSVRLAPYLALVLDQPGRGGDCGEDEVEQEEAAFGVCRSIGPAHTGLFWPGMKKVFSFHSRSDREIHKYK